MLEYLVIFGRGGVILWTFGQLLNVKGNATNSLIRTCLLEDRGGEGSYTYRPPVGSQYTLKWKFHNHLVPIGLQGVNMQGLDLVVVAAYQHMLSVPFVDALLTSMRDEFAAVYKPDVFEYQYFDDTYKRLLSRAQKNSIQTRSKPSNGNNSQSISSSAYDGAQPSTDEDDDNETDSRGPHSNENGQQNGIPSAASAQKAFNVDALAKRGKSKQPTAKKEVSTPKPPTGKKGKKPRNWNGTEADVGDLDYSGDGGSQQAAAAAANPAKTLAERSRMEVTEAVSFAEDDKALESQMAAKTKNSAAAAPTGVLGSVMASLQTRIVGKEALSAEDVQAAVAVMQKRLQQRNVSSAVASKVCASVAATLEGKKLASFTGVASLVRSAMEQSITRILSPPRSTDILAEVRASQARGKPYSIVFVGVNGVGKSTNLAKVAYWLRQQDLRVMIAACDTFRSGAVEQLKTHCNRLGVPLYDRGYDRDPTNVAAEAMRQAQRDGVDVVLVDTAGRMQDNEPLMQALSMLINKNNPDLVLFVGEALVGNDGVDQLVKFNQRLADLSPPGKDPRLIDGVLVTKFDAIDNKVGAVLSMAYSSGAPIMFVGCGQTYVDLMRLDVRSVVKSLLQ